MTLSYLEVAVICAGYLLILFSIAHTTDRGWVPEKLVSHPIIYIFSLGIFASAWAFYGVIELAGRYGYGALAYYIGTGALFMFAPYLLKPLIELARRFQINSMADLLVFRYHSHLVGGVVTLAMLLAMAPLLSLQMQAVADTIHLLTQNNHDDLNPAFSEFGVRQSFALIYCAVITLFALVFGADRAHHRGLVTVMAFESIVKVFGLLAVGLYVVFEVFGGFNGLDTWLAEHPEFISALRASDKDGSAHALMLVFIATAVSMPHIFHMTVVENPIKHTHKTVTWAFPLFLLVMAVPVFPILWGGKALGLESPVEYFPLSVPMAQGSHTFALIAFVGGLSASTGAMVAIALALTTMILNHWILPLIRLQVKEDVYRQIVWLRRTLIAAVVLGGYLFYVLLNNRFVLTDLALTSFIATLQLLPAVIAVAHWPRANRKGLIAGLLTGSGIWLFGLMLPMLFDWNALDLPGIGTFALGVGQWKTITLWSLGLNIVMFLLVSIATDQSDEERYGAELCSKDELSHPVRLTLDVRSPHEIIERLSTRIGQSTAEQEVRRALSRLNLHANESRPYALRRLRDEIEANLSSLIGITMASEIMDKLVPFRIPESPGATDINLIESRLGQVRDHLTGLAAELNNLRLYHRRTLEQLPLATCSVGQDLEILMWNSAMIELTGIPSDRVTGSHLEDVDAPWGELLHKFALSREHRFYKRQIQLNNRPHWVTLHKAAIPSSLAHQIDGQVILLEDVTELQTLENELVHSERLASIGRLAAGVAHEIGNPVTGIACLAQNLQYEHEPEEIQETGEQILSLTDRVSRIVHSLVSFAHAGNHDVAEFTEVSPRECVQEAINLLSLQKEKRQVRFANNIPPELDLKADSQRLIQVFINLLANARDASPEDGQIVIEAATFGDTVRISVTDEGSGIPKQAVDRVFEPFFTTKEPGEGTGLGLAMVYSIVEDHNGDIEIDSPVDSDKGTGTRFVINLPRDLKARSGSSNT